MNKILNIKSFLTKNIIHIFGIGVVLTYYLIVIPYLHKKGSEFISDLRKTDSVIIDSNGLIKFRFAI